MSNGKGMTDPTKCADSDKSCSGTSEKCTSPENSKVYLYVDVKSFFKIQHEDALTPLKQKDAGKRIQSLALCGVLAAEVTMAGCTGKTAKVRINKDGSYKWWENVYKPAKLDITGLSDGTYTLTVKPPPDRLSTRPAGPYESGYKAKNYKDLEKAFKYRAIDDVKVTIQCGKADKAWIPRLDYWEERPWEWTFKNAWVEMSQSDTVYVDIKPDWWSSASPKQEKRNAEKIDQIALHNTGIVSDGKDGHRAQFGAALGQGFKSWCAQYYVDLDGHVVKIMDCETMSAMHGVGNLHAVGIEHGRNKLYFQEVAVPWSNLKQSYLQELQFRSSFRLIGELISKYNIPKHRIFGHCDAKKLTCPGPDFWWNLLEARGYGMVLNLAATVSNPVYDIWFNTYDKITLNYKSKKAKDAKSGKEVKGQEVLDLIEKDLKDICYPVTGTANVEKGAKHFRFHFYAGARYHLMDPNAKQFPAATGQAVVGRDALNRKHIDKDLALHIRNVADYVRNHPDYNPKQLTKW